MRPDGDCPRNAAIGSCGQELQSWLSRLVEEWTREWVKGAQSDLHLDCVPMTKTEKASRIQEYLNHCSL